MATMSETKPKLCSRCGEPLAGPELSGNCPRCLAGWLLSPESAAAVEVSPIPVLRLLGDYELLEEVARGGMGVVFRSRQVSLNRIVAIKVLRDAWLATPVQVKRFRAEAANAAKLKHPNIVTVHEVGEQSGQHYFAMNLVEGTNLAELAREGPLAPRRAAELVKKVAEAVQHAHQEGVLHRDLKPSNVLLDAQDEPQVTDFGLARPMDDESSLTLTGQVLGTPGYMAPEQAKGGGAVGPAADVYGLGALLFHLLTGRAPFVGAGAAETLTQVLQQEPLSPRLLNPAVTVDLAAVCLKCLRKPPRERYGSARELAADLDRFLRNKTTHARPEGPLERSARWCRRKPALAAALAALQVVGVLGLAGIVWEWRRAEREAHTAKEELWHAQLLEARSHRLNGGAGQRIKTLEVVAEATAYRPSVALRNEAIAALVLPDLGSNVWWHAEDHVVPPTAFTHDLAYFLQSNPTGRVVVCRAPDLTMAVEFDGGSVTGLASAAFSPDDRLLAIRFNDGAVGVWDWREKRLLLRGDSLDGYRRLPTLDFTPDGRELCLLGKDSRLLRYSTTNGQPLPGIQIEIHGEGLQLDPSGRRLLTVDDGRVSAWELNPPALAGEWMMTNKVYCLAWHPDGEHFVLGAAQSGLFVGEIGQTELEPFEHPAAGGDLLTAAFFTPDGGYLLAGGWGDFLGVWDAATHRLEFQSRDAWFGQINRAGNEVFVGQERRGYGVRRFLNPVGVQRMRLPRAIASAASVAAWHPGGRWLVAGHELGWTLWDAVEGKLLDKRRGGSCSSVQFLPRGDAFVTGGGDGPQFWPLKIAAGKPLVGESRPLLPPNSGATQRAAVSPDGKRFAAVGMRGAFLGGLDAGSRPTPIPGGADNCFVQFSPDGQWICISNFKGETVKLHSAATGALVTNLPTGGFIAWFVPGRNELVAHAPSAITWWELGTWKLRRRVTPRDRTLPDEPIGFWPDGSCALANGRDTMLRLWDLEAGREIAALRLPESSASWTPAFDHVTGRVVTPGGFPYCRVWDFAALRRELRVLGLDWPDLKPGSGFVGADDRLRAPRL